MPKKPFLLYFAVGADDQCYGPYWTADEAKADLAEQHGDDQITSLEGFSIFEGTEIFSAQHCLTWVSAK